MATIQPQFRPFTPEAGVVVVEVETAGVVDCAVVGLTAAEGVVVVAGVLVAG